MRPLGLKGPCGPWAFQSQVALLYHHRPSHLTKALYSPHSRQDLPIRNNRHSFGFIVQVWLCHGFTSVPQKRIVCLASASCVDHSIIYLLPTALRDRPCRTLIRLPQPPSIGRANPELQTRHLQLYETAPQISTSAFSPVAWKTTIYPGADSLLMQNQLRTAQSWKKLWGICTWPTGTCIHIFDLAYMNVAA